MMAMKHNGGHRCPYCFSRVLEIIDYGVADKQYHERFGRYWFKKKCKKCGGHCEVITKLEDSNEKEVGGTT